MNPAAPSGPLPADGPLDHTDVAILAGIREVFETVDPMPADLPERVRFALAMRDLEAEVARLTVVEEPALAARGEEHSRTITFESDSLTIMIRIDGNGDGTARIDGWLAPPRRCEVQITSLANQLTVAVDEQGRFVFPCVPPGSAQLVVRPSGQEPGMGQRTVVTPTLIL
jgi:hypothetical protein